MGRQAVVLVLLVMWAAVLVSGCGAPPTASVRGEVIVDGKPLSKGVISFTSMDGTGQPATTNIKNGKYEVTLAPGKKRVVLSAPVVTGKRQEYKHPEAPWVEITEESLLDRYTNKSDLTFDVQPGDNTKNWTAESKNAKK